MLRLLRAIALMSATAISAHADNITLNVSEFNQFSGIQIGHSSNNGDGVTVIGNSVIRNGGYGMIAQHTVYGSNIFRANGFGSVAISPGIEVTSQNNNNCNGNVC